MSLDSFAPLPMLQSHHYLQHPFCSTTNTHNQTAVLFTFRICNLIFPFSSFVLCAFYLLFFDCLAFFFSVLVASFFCFASLVYHMGFNIIQNILSGNTINGLGHTKYRLGNKKYWFRRYKSGVQVIQILVQVIQNIFLVIQYIILVIQNIVLVIQYMT